MTYQMVPDFSYHQWNIDYDLVAKHVGGFIFRCAYGISIDTRFRYHVQHAASTGKPIAAYQWFRPDEDVKAQIDTVRRQLDGLPVRVIWSDVEQHGRAGWKNLPPHYGQQELSDKAYAHVSGLEAFGFEAGVYTRSTWVFEHARPMVYQFDPVTQRVYKPWMYERALVWLASWPYKPGTLATTWEDMKNVHAPKSFLPYFHSSWPDEKRTAGAWQFTGDKFTLPGVLNDLKRPSAVDLNYVKNEVLEKFRMDAPPPEPDPEPKPPITLEQLAKEVDELQNQARQRGWPV